MIASSGLSAGDVDDVDRHTKHTGDGDGAVGRFALHFRRARQHMTFRPGDAHCQQLLLELEHQLAVLGVHRGQRPQLQRACEAVHQHLVVGHDRVLVGHEVLEAVHAVLVHQRAHVFMYGLVPPGDGDMEAVVGGRLLGPAAPFLVRLQQVLFRRRDHEVDDHRRAAGEARGSAAVEVLARHGSHEGQLHMRVRVDPARHDILPAGIYCLRPGRDVEILPDGDDLALVAQDIGPEGPVRVHHCSASNDQCHSRPRCSCRSSQAVTPEPGLFGCVVQSPYPPTLRPVRGSMLPSGS